jgi:hypothetical protein
MTILVGITTPDGLVLAAESRTTFSDGARHRIASDNAQKIFAIGHMAVGAAGNAFIGSETISGKMDRFIAHLDERTGADLDRFCRELGKFFNDAFAETLKATNETWDVTTQGYPIDLLVAGYDDHGVGYIKEILIPGPTVSESGVDTTTGGTMWRGQTDVIGRLLQGVDLTELELSGATVPDELTQKLETFSYIAMPPLTVRDAVEYATFLIRTTIDMQRFSDGTVAHPGLVPGCGGPIHALVVERTTVRWASRSTREDWEQPSK